MPVPLSDKIKEQLSETEWNTIESILVIVRDASKPPEDNDFTDSAEECKKRCDIAAEVGNAGCDAMESPIARAACRLAVKVSKEGCYNVCDI
ncbi:hypothetical protein [Bacillus cereus]|uniref:hypothetical protein n=1 Tax=Bacillus cereus TaxID=1396 RepID=UPI00397F3A2F